jgi:vitamin B12 transporter
MLPSARADQGKSTSSAIVGENAVRRFLMPILSHLGRNTRRVPDLAEKTSAPILLICFFLILLANPSVSVAQLNISLTGYIYDKDDGLAISGAVIELTGTAYKSITDDFGSFVLENIPPGPYELKVTAPGFDSLIIPIVEILSDIPARLHLRLSPKIYQLGRIIVRGERILSAPENVEVLLRHQIEQSKARDLPELLENTPGLYIQRSGSVAGRSEVRIRGSDPRHVLILLDGHKINSAATGVADLSTIPVELVERVEIHKGGASAQFGPDALGGVINIITRPKNHNKRLSVEGGNTRGAWGTNIYSLNVFNPIAFKNLSTLLTYQGKKSDGDFDYTYEVYPDPVPDSDKRVNNDVNSCTYFTSGDYILGDRLKISYSGQYYRSLKGLPDRAKRQNKYARFTDRRKLISTDLQYRKLNGDNIKTDFAFSRYEQRYTDDSSRVIYDDQYTNDIFTLRHEHQYLIQARNKLRLGAEFQRDILYHTDFHNPGQSMGKTVRDNIGLFVIDEQSFDISRLRLTDNLVLSGSLRFDRVNTRKDSTSARDSVKTNRINNWSPKIKVALIKGEKFSYILRAAYGKSLCLPSINSLFWIGDPRRSHGNPGLKPERSEHSEAGVELKGELGSMTLSGGVTYFHSFIRDLVDWAYSVGVWQPVNIDKAQITGHEDFVELNLFDRSLSIKYQNTITTALNKSEGHTIYNMRLIMYPHYIQNLKAALRCKLWETSLSIPWIGPAFDISTGINSSYSIRWVGDVYVKKSNTKYYAGYRLDDLSVGLKFDIATLWSFAIDYKIYNVRNTPYVLMALYPMPGREWNFGLKLTYGIHDTN